MIYLNNRGCYWSYRWYCYYFGYVRCCLCETVDIITSSGTVVCLVLNVERNKIGAIALDTDANIKPVYIQYVVVV